MKKVILSIATCTILAASFTSCKKEEDPVTNPVVIVEELITTMKLTVTDTLGIVQVFTYKVENGFGSTTQGSVQIDTVKLHTNSVYTYNLLVLNETEDPAENITTEVLAEQDEHLFFFASNPSSGAGSVSISDGSKDNANLPFNQTGKINTSTTGSGQITITLLHEPTNKNGTSTAATGGETDAEAIFPVKLQ